MSESIERCRNVLRRSHTMKTERTVTMKSGAAQQTVRVTYGIARLLGAVAVFAICMGWIKTRCADSPLLAVTTAAALGGVFLLFRKSDASAVAVEALFAVVCGAVCYELRLPDHREVFEANPVTLIDLPNAQRGVIFGWLVGALCIRLLRKQSRFFNGGAMNGTGQAKGRGPILTFPGGDQRGRSSF